jgi:hypothetical protein
MVLVALYPESFSFVTVKGLSTTTSSLDSSGAASAGGATSWAKTEGRKASKPIVHSRRVKEKSIRVSFMGCRIRGNFRPETEHGTVDPRRKTGSSGNIQTGGY